MQFDMLFLTTLLLFVLLLSASIIITALGLAARKRYESERKGVASGSILGSFGNRLSNAVPAWFVVPYMVLIVMTIYTGVFLFRSLFDLWTFTLIGMSVFGGIFIIEVAYFAFTTGGRARWRIGKMAQEYNVFGHEDWVLQIRLAELMSDVKDSKSFRSRVAKRTLDSLMVKENLLGDAVRRIMSNPDQLQNAEDRSTIPGQWRYFRFSILLIVLLAVSTVILSWGVFVGSSSGLELATGVLPIAFVLSIALLFSLCVEGASVNEKRQKAHLADQDAFYSANS